LIVLYRFILSYHKVNKSSRLAKRMSCFRGTRPGAGDEGTDDRKKDFTSALGNVRLTPFYDLAIRLLTRENVWREALIQQINLSSSDCDGDCYAKYGQSGCKVLIDLSYPPMIVADDGYFQTNVETSSAEMIQNWNPGAKVVKAFGTLGSDAIDDPKSIGGPLTVPIASNHRDVKEKVARITAELGLDPVDAGPLRMARNIESLQILLMVPLLQKRDAAWDIYFRRSNYWMCNPYVTADGVYEFPTAPDADNLAEIPYTQGLPEPCP
jgi:hypothetical protein